MARDGTATRLLLMRTAEKLFAERGFEGVSLREVAAVAGQRNHSAASYHFGTKEALVDAILHRHSAAIHVGYDAAMDEVEAAGRRLSLYDLLRMLVLPIVAKIDDADGGPFYLALCAQLAVSPALPLETRPVASTPPVMRISTKMIEVANMPADLLPLRLTRLAGTIYTSTLQYDRLTRAGMLEISRTRFEEDLIDTLAALLATPREPSRERLQAHG